jgi:predicted GTPase
VVINKVDTADYQDIQTVRNNVARANPNATLIEAASPLFVAGSEQIAGRRVLVIEDGPTLTHGGMRFGAGVIAAQRFKAREIVDPRPWVVGSLRETFKKYPHIGPLLPAMGYSEEQMRDLAQTIDVADCDLVLIATPVDLGRILDLRKPNLRVQYELQEIGTPNLESVLREFLA